MHQLTLRGRLAMMAAAAVAIAIMLAATSAWLITRNQLVQQLDANLRTSATSASHKGDPTNVCRLASNTISTRYAVNLQVITPTGQPMCGWIPSNTPKLQQSDLAVAESDVIVESFREGVTYGGGKVRVYVVTYPSPYGHFALIASESMSVVDDPMSSLALLYLGIAALGVLLAASTGLVIARAGLTPVDRLTQAAEHIALTEDLSITLPIDGNDEIARLGQAFNTMTHALAESRERQRRLHRGRRP